MSFQVGKKVSKVLSGLGGKLQEKGVFNTWMLKEQDQVKLSLMCLSVFSAPLSIVCTYLNKRLFYQLFLSSFQIQAFAKSYADRIIAESFFDVIAEKTGKGKRMKIMRKTTYTVSVLVSIRDSPSRILYGR